MAVPESFSHSVMLRAAAGYRLLGPENLPKPMPAWLVRYAAHSAFGGLLIREEEDFRAQRVVNRATALLFIELARPQPAPPSIPIRSLQALVLDGVLEIRAGRRYVSGGAAHRIFFPAADKPAPSSVLATLSLNALRQTAALELPGASASARLLYAFNTLPATPAWRERYADPVALERELLLGMPHGSRLRAPDQVEGGAWLSWDRTPAPRPGRRIWKLYLSPMPDLVRPTLHAASRVAGAFSMKVGRDLYNILRPDKLVLYFASRRGMLQAARRLSRELAGVAAQGVPFTGQLFDSALISWGVDPGGHGHAAPWAGDESWRARLTQRLASALAQATRDPGCTVPAWRFAMDRLSLDDVDVGSWSPDAVGAAGVTGHDGDH